MTFEVRLENKLKFFFETNQRFYLNVLSLTNINRIYYIAQPLKTLCRELDQILLFSRNKQLTINKWLKSYVQS